MSEDTVPDPALQAYKVALAELTARYQLKLRELREAYKDAKSVAWAAFKSERGRLRAGLRLDRDRTRNRVAVPMGADSEDREFRADTPRQPSERA